MHNISARIAESEVADFLNLRLGELARHFVSCLVDDDAGKSGDGYNNARDDHG